MHFSHNTISRISHESSRKKVEAVHPSDKFYRYCSTRERARLLYLTPINSDLCRGSTSARAGCVASTEKNNTVPIAIDFLHLRVGYKAISVIRC